MLSGMASISEMKSSICSLLHFWCGFLWLLWRYLPPGEMEQPWEAVYCVKMCKQVDEEWHGVRVKDSGRGE